MPELICLQQLGSGYIFGLKNTNLSSFQRLIGVQGEDSYQKCGKASYRGVWHKMNRPRRRSLPSWTSWLMTCASKPCSWTVPIPVNKDRRLTSYPRKAKSCTEINSGIRRPPFTLKKQLPFVQEKDRIVE
jgi:hypothetical protein